jgi:DNA end-binding protein Ku
MARATWSGFLSFGLVSIPVGLFVATSDQTIHFNQLHEGTSNRIRYKKIDEETGEELTADEIVSGYPVGGGEYIVVTPEEMDEAAPGKSELIEIQDFVDLMDIDPIYFRQTYYLAPKGKGADRAYALLHQVMFETSKVGIATLVLRDKEHLVAIRPGDDVLILETMYFQDEILDASEELETLPHTKSADTRELKVAKQLVSSLSNKWDPSRYKNTYRERIEALVEKKREGNDIVFSDEEDTPHSNVIDLMSALRASIKRTGSGATSKTKKTSSTRSSRAPAKVPTKSRSQLEAMTKAQLLTRAKKVKIDVTPAMTKVELVKALSKAGAPAKKTRRAS